MVAETVSHPCLFLSAPPRPELAEPPVGLKDTPSGAWHLEGWAAGTAIGGDCSGSVGTYVEVGVPTE